MGPGDIDYSVIPGMRLAAACCYFVGRAVLRAWSWVWSWFPGRKRGVRAGEYGFLPDADVIGDWSQVSSDIWADIVSSILVFSILFAYIVIAYALAALAIWVIHG